MKPMNTAQLAAYAQPTSRTITAAQKRTLRMQRAMCHDQLRRTDTAAARASVVGEITRIDALLSAGLWPR